jgi:diamine N-acetyltransferase
MDFNTIDMELKPETLEIENEKVIFRLLDSYDGEKLRAYFENLSETTKGYFGPHPLNKETAINICSNLDLNNNVIYFVVTTEDKTRIIAYFLLFLGVLDHDRKRYFDIGLKLSNTNDCSLAPSVLDEYQDKHLGSLIIEKTLGIAKQLKKERMILWGGVKAENPRAIHFYEKFGFKKIGEFEHQGLNYDMMLELK